MEKEQALTEQIAELFKEYRQELCNTEFAPPPFDDRPVNPKLANEYAEKTIASLAASAAYQSELAAQASEIERLKEAITAFQEAGIEILPQYQTLRISAYGEFRPYGGNSPEHNLWWSKLAALTSKEDKE